MKHSYCDMNFRSTTLKIIKTANEIINEYKSDGFDLTVRQLYYQFVARDIIPNKMREYKKLCSIVNNGRLAGLIDWESIVDRTRKYDKNPHWDSPADILESAAESYGIDTRADQKNYVEVWVEKEALANIVERVSKELDVGYLSCRGFVSQSVMWRAARRFKIREVNGKKCTLIYLGDHDPSGLDMSRDIQDRLEMFGSQTKVDRIALNMEQIKKHKLPPNPAKTTDSQYDNYTVEYGDDSWELDALDPRILTGLINVAVLKYTDQKKRHALIRKQESERKQIRQLAIDWND